LGERRREPGDLYPPGSCIYTAPVEYIRRWYVGGGGGGGGGVEVVE